MSNRSLRTRSGPIRRWRDHTRRSDAERDADPAPAHRRYRATAGLVAFVALCVVPTAGTAYLAYYIHRPEYSDEIAEGLTHWLGLPVEIADVTYPLPGSVEYHNLKLRGRREGPVIASLERLRMSRQQSRWLLQASAVRLDSQSPDEASGRVDGELPGPDPVAVLLERFRPAGVGKVEFSVSDLVLRCGGNQWKCSRTQLQYDLNGFGQLRLQGKLQFHPEKEIGSVEFALTLSRGPDLSLRAVQIDADSAPVPLGLLALWTGTAGPLEQSAEFRGRLQARRVSSGWQGQLQGELSGVELEQLVGRRSPYRLSGPSRWHIEQLRWRGDQIESLVGRLDAGPGSVDAALLHALAAQAGFRVHIAVPRRGLVAYRQLAFQFHIEDGLVQIGGQCDDSDGGAVLIADDEMLLQQPSSSAPVMGLIQALRFDRAAGSLRSPVRSPHWLSQWLSAPDEPSSVAVPGSLPPHGLVPAADGPQR